MRAMRTALIALLMLGILVDPCDAKPKGKRYTLERNQSLGHARVPVPPENLVNSGVVRYAMLPGDIGYVYLRKMFRKGNRFEESFTEAMNHVKDAKGLVVDLRGNGGGGMAEPFTATFTGRGTGVLDEPWDRPVAVLIDAGAFSAGEGAWLRKKCR